jgi:proton-dependent oligopeptide transporter, POT family
MNVQQPKILRLLSFVQMCKFFSHYGLRALLVLYMVNQLQFSDSHAFGVNAVFCGLVELGGIFGGILADRYLGLRRALMLGGIFLGVGYVSLILEKGLFFSLGMIILGGSLFSSNITALLGAAYSENDPRREKGFTIFYMMQNLGALISTLLCAVIAIQYGFYLGFLVASIGMMVGIATLFWRRDLLSKLDRGSQDKPALILAPIILLILGIGFLAVGNEGIILPLLPWITVGIFCFFAIKLMQAPKLTKWEVKKLLIYLGGLILFFAAEDQICSSLIIFSERETERTLFGWTIPSSVIMSVNPIIIILFGNLIARLKVRFIIPFVLVAISFGTLALLCLFHVPASFLAVIAMVMIVSLAELMVGPFVSSIASEVAAKDKPGMVMGMVPIAFSLASLLGGGFSKMVAVEENSLSLMTYGAGFGKIALLTLIGGMLLQLLIKRLINAKRSVS